MVSAWRIRDLNSFGCMSEPNSPLKYDSGREVPLEEPPYGIIARKMKAGNVVPFLGAGASLIGRPSQDAKFDDKNPTFLPNGWELAEVLAKESSFPSEEASDRNDLAKVSSYFQDVSGRADLRDRLRQLLHPEPGVVTTDIPENAAQPRTIHRLLAGIAKPQIIVTTNYDTLIEEAFAEAKRAYHLIVYPADNAEVYNGVLWQKPGGREFESRAANEMDWESELKDATVIFKMHGTIYPESKQFDNFVITEEDYVEFLSRMIKSTAIPPTFYEQFATRNFLFLGYGLRDWNLRVLLKNLGNQLSRGGKDRPRQHDRVEQLSQASGTGRRNPLEGVRCPAVSGAQQRR